MTESMLPNEALQSQLSAFVDGELPSLETELLARRLAREPELQRAMGRYLLLGEALRAPIRGGVSRSFSAKIAAAIEQADTQANGKEPQLVEPTARKRSMLQAAPWLKSAAGIAVAASVALVAVLVVRAPQQATGTALAQQAAKSSAAAQLAANAATGESYVVPAVANVPSAPIPAARLTNYVVAHSEFTSPLGQRNMLMGLLSGDQTTTDTKSAEAKSAADADTHAADKVAHNPAGQ